MTFTYSIALLAFGLFLGSLLFLEAGRRYGLWRMAKDPEGARDPQPGIPALGSHPD